MPALAARGDRVVPQAQFVVDDRGQRLDPVSVYFAELLDPIEDIVELGYHRLDLRIAHGDAGELGDVPNLLGIYGHAGAASRAALRLQPHSKSSPTGFPSTNTWRRGMVRTSIFALSRSATFGGAGAGLIVSMVSSLARSITVVAT